MSHDSVPFRALRRREPARKIFELKVVGLSLIATLGALALSFLLFQWQDWAGDEANLATDQMVLARQMATAASGLDSVSVAQARAVFLADEHADGAIYVAADGHRLGWARPGFDTTSLRVSGRAEPRVISGFDGILINLPQHANGRRIGEFVLHAHNREIVEGARRNMLVETGVSLLAMLVAAFVARLLARRALRPLYALGRAIAEVRRTKDFGHPAEILSDDEFGRLGEGFNALLAELEAFSQTQRQTLTNVTAGRDAAEEANLLKSRFLANMSHEIRTPLNGVLGMAQVVLMGELSDVQRARLEVIQKSGADLLSILNDILDLSKIEAGGLELDDAGFDIEDVARGACDVFVAAAQAKGLTFALEVSGPAKGSWRGDPMRLRQVFSNLASNAVKFTSVGGVRVVIDRTAEGLSIIVADTGIGVAPENLPRLFERFTQVDASTTRRFGGTGLGLTISRDIVALMGGAIEVRSELGRGTTFEVSLPLDWLGAGDREVDADDGRGQGGDGRPSVDLSRLRVLAAEDNPTNQLVLRAILASLGVEPLFVENGRAAVDVWKAGDFDLILMDIQMPTLDGAAATREIRALEAKDGLSRTSIVALSANAMSHQVAEYIAAGMDSHLAKPILIADLYATLVDACATSARRGSGLCEVSGVFRDLVQIRGLKVQLAVERESDRLEVVRLFGPEAE
jgi:signal transduction histidine kinase/CheY-like chemotaxis protein